MHASRQICWNYVVWMSTFTAWSDAILGQPTGSEVGLARVESDILQTSWLVILYSLVVDCLRIPIISCTCGSLWDCGYLDLWQSRKLCLFCNTITPDCCLCDAVLFLHYVAAKATYIRLLHGKIGFFLGGGFGPSSVTMGRTHIVLGWNM